MHGTPSPASTSECGRVESRSGQATVTPSTWHQHLEIPINIARYKLLAAGASCIALAACVSLRLGEPQRGVIIGRVVAARDSIPLAGAYLILWGAGSSTTTDSAGRFTLPRPQGGMDSITISRVGYVPITLPALPLASRDTLQFVAMLNSFEDRFPGRYRECSFNSLPVRDCNAAAPYDGPMLILDNVIMLDRRSGSDGSLINARSAQPQAEIMRIEVRAGPSATTLYGQRAWYGVVTVNTVLCPPKPIDPRRPSYSCR